MHTSLIITTYNRPDALELVLKSCFAQSQLPEEIIIADDGSGDETRALVSNYTQMHIPVRHIWQEDRGFRAARVRNLAAAHAQYPYLIFIDGDMMVHPMFVASHLATAEAGQFIHAKRAMMSERLTQRVLNKKQIAISPLASGISLRRHAFHSDFLSKRLSFDSTDWYRTQSANLSLWKDDLIAVNGFNEDFEGWGREDSELALRLMRSGLKKRELRFNAVAFHLAHGKDNKLKAPDGSMHNQMLLDQTESNGMTRCENGIDKHLRDKST